MAQRQTTTYVDDLTGRELSADQHEAVTFALDGSTYELDTTPREAERLRKALAPFVAAARTARGSGPTRRRARGRSVDPATVRAWALRNGIDVADRGRVPRSVLARYRAAGN